MTEAMDVDGEQNFRSCLSSLIDTGTVESHRYYLARKTLLEMLRDRGFAVPNCEIEVSLAEFRSKHSDNPDVDGLRISSLHKDDPSIKALVLFCEPGIVKVNVVRGIAGRIVQEGLDRLIIIVQGKITSQASKAVELFPFKVEIFQITDLLVNVTKHELKPKHQVLTIAEKENLLKQYSIEEKQLPRMLQKDAIARYYGLEKGQFAVYTIAFFPPGAFIRCSSSTVAKMNEKMSLNLGDMDPLSPTPYSTPFESPESGGSGRVSAARIAEVKMWLASQFHEAGKHVPDFEYTPQSISYLRNIVTLSQAQTEAASIVLNDFHHKSAEYRAQAARMREILEKMGLARESLPSKLVSSANTLAIVANLLDIRDTELSSFLVAAFDLSQRKAEVEEKRAQAQQESKQLLDFTRKALARLTYLKRTLMQLENDIAPSQAEMEHWETNMAILDKKETQYLQEYSNYKKLLDRLNYSPEIRHGVLVEIADHRKALQLKTKPIVESLQSYHDLPPDKAMAALAIEEKKRQFAAAEKYLEDVLQSAIPE